MANPKEKALEGAKHLKVKHGKSMEFEKHGYNTFDKKYSLKDDRHYIPHLNIKAKERKYHKPLTAKDIPW